MIAINSAARALVDNVTLSTDVEDKIQTAANHLTAAYNEGYDEGSKRAPNMQGGLWAEATDHKVTQYNEPVLFAIRYQHNQDGVIREILCASEHAVQAELHVLLLRNDSAGIAVVRVNRD